MSTTTFDQLTREASDLFWLVRMAADLADKADREGDLGDVTRVAVLLRAIKHSAGAHCDTAAFLRRAADTAPTTTEPGRA